MALATGWAADPLPRFLLLDGFSAAIATDDAELAHINRLAPGEVQARRAAGHRPYVARLNGAVAYGWVATMSASIGELGLALSLPPYQRYLWDFATLPGYRGLGLYPRLLHSIREAEVGETSRGIANRFWIIRAPENLPSGAGMRRFSAGGPAFLSAGWRRGPGPLRGARAGRCRSRSPRRSPD